VVFVSRKVQKIAVIWAYRLDFGDETNGRINRLTDMDLVVKVRCSKERVLSEVFRLQNTGFPATHICYALSDAQSIADMGELGNMSKQAYHAE